MPNPIDADDVPDILAFLSWNEQISGAIPTEDERQSIECGRMAILEACRRALLKEADSPGNPLAAATG